MDFVPTPTLLQTLVANEKLHAHDAFDGAFDAAKIGLATNALPTGSDLVFADDIDLPAYTGYAAATVTWGATFKDADGDYGLVGSAHTFQATDALGTAANVQAVYLYLTGSPNVVLAVCNLDSPKVLSGPLDALTVLPEVRLPLATIGKLTILD